MFQIWIKLPIQFYVTPKPNNTISTDLNWYLKQNATSVLQWYNQIQDWTRSINHWRMHDGVLNLCYQAPKSPNLSSPEGTSYFPSLAFSHSKRLGRNVVVFPPLQLTYLFSYVANSHDLAAMRVLSPSRHQICLHF